MFKETTKNVKCATGYFVGRYDCRGFGDKELFVVGKLDFDSNVNIAVGWGTIMKVSGSLLMGRVT